MNTPFLMVILSGSALPLLALLTLLLRRNLFKGKLKIIFLVIGLSLLLYSIIETFSDHKDVISLTDVVIALITGLITFFILAKFNHNHTHSSKLDGVKGIVISEAFHSIIDGAIIGATYLISPLLGYAATTGIIVHELPKILGTITILRSFDLSIKKTIYFGILAQIGSPISAILVYMLGKEVNHNEFHMLEIASISSLATIVIWIIYLEIRYHIKHKKHE